jgi:hypothetical protein
MKKIVEAVRLRIERGAAQQGWLQLFLLGCYRDENIVSGTDIRRKREEKYGAL